MTIFFANTSLKTWIPLLCPALLAASWLIFAERKDIVLDKSLPISLELPKSVTDWTLVGVAYCQNDQCMIATEYQDIEPHECPICHGEVDAVPLAEKLILPVDTTIKHGRYKDTNGNVIELAIVVSGVSRSSLHRPEWCLPGQGFYILSRYSMPIDTNPIFMVSVLELDKNPKITPSQQYKGIFLYWFVGPSMETPYRSRMLIEMTKERIFQNKAYRWAYVAILTPKTNLNHTTLDYTKNFVSVLRQCLYNPAEKQQ